MWNFNIDKVNLFAYQEGSFTKEECKKIIDISKNKKLIKGKVFDNTNDNTNANTSTNKKIRDSKICWLYSYEEEVAWIYQRITDIVLGLNIQFFQFDLFGISEALQFTSYKAPGGKYGKHVDRTYNIPVRKLSISIQLTDPKDYEGGELKLYIGENKDALIMNKNQGALIIFPSYVLHEVMPVTKGERNSLVTWVSGNQFK
jgi:PKHD-type hydroxylase